MFFFLSKRNIRNKLLDYIRAVYKKNFKNPLESLSSFLTATLAFISLVLIFSYTPITSTTLNILSYNLQKQNNIIKKTFSFIPGSVPAKFNKIDLHNLNILSYYDLPFNSDGSLVTDAEGYYSLHTDSTYNLFQTAHFQGTKVLATLTQTNRNDILDFLNNSDSQENLFQQVTQLISNSEIDGITIDVEFLEKTDKNYKDKYTNFISKLTQYMHKNIPGSIVAIALPNNINENGIYDIKKLADMTDHTLIIAYDIAVPETNNSKLNFTGKNNFNMVPENKLVMERAWYGNSDNYTLYSEDKPSEYASDSSQNTMNTPLSSNTIEKLISDIPYDAQNSARKNIPYITDALKKEKILNANVLAYALATIQHETAGTFEPIEEFKGRKNARRLGYEGGTNYFGRGFIQLTHMKNYQKFGERIGMGEQLVENPGLASRPEIAAKILAAYFKDFGIARLASDGNFIDARTLINPDYNGWTIAQIAYEYLNAIV